jgi:3-deoxy-D-arabino-heptulosonate 7-phosphate (DAHP) synthase
MAAARDADLVVVGSRDLANSTLLRSASRSVVGQSDRAVLIAKNGRHSSGGALQFKEMTRSPAQGGALPAG